jgi:NADH-quinone oxidoreductase subunit E
MAIETTNGKATLATVQAVVSRRGAHRDELIPILNEVNHELGFLPSDALDEVARLLQVPRSNVFSVATFYEMLNTQERGRHVILFCESAPCHVVGGREVWSRLRREVGLEAGQTSEDKRWSLVAVSCLGVCGVGPVVVIDDDMYGNVSPEALPAILAKYE